jgi:hypothetical protein
MALVVVYCDDCIVTGRGTSVDRIKAGISKSVKISDLGKLKRHLGVDYEFGREQHWAVHTVVDGGLHSGYC